MMSCSGFYLFGTYNDIIWHVHSTCQLKIHSGVTDYYLHSTGDTHNNVYYLKPARYVNIQCIGNVVTKKTGSKYYYLFTTGSAVSHSGQAYFNSFNVTEHSSYSIDSGDLQPGISIDLIAMNFKIYDGSETMNEVTDFTNKYIEVYQVSKYSETTHLGSGNVQGSGGLETDYYVDYDLLGRQEISTVDNLPTTPDSRFIVL